MGSIGISDKLFAGSKRLRVYLERRLGRPVVCVGRHRIEQNRFAEPLFLFSPRSLCVLACLAAPAAALFARPPFPQHPRENAIEFVVPGARGITFEVNGR